MTQIVAHLREGLDPTGGVRGAKTLVADTARKAFDAEAAQELYQRLFGELDAVLGDRELQVVADGPLAALPLSVLVTEPLQEGQRPRWLVMRNAVSVLPSLSMLRLRDIPARETAATGFVGFGAAVFQSGPDDGTATGENHEDVLRSLAPLPGTRREIEAIGAVFPQAERAEFLGKQATEAAVKAADLKGRKVVAFATHGLVAGDLGEDSEPGLAFTQPAERSAADDGFLTASEAATLNIDADWLLLSACNTAASDGNPDSGGYAGLARAFLFAGARSILVSHWPVRDDVAARLTVDAVQWLVDHPGETPARALQQAMVSTIEASTLPGHEDPAVWAPFVLFASGR